MIDTEHRCEATIYSGWASYACGCNAKLEHEGKWYCKRHHPPTMAERSRPRKEARELKWKAEQDARTRSTLLQGMAACISTKDLASCKIVKIKK